MSAPLRPMTLGEILDRTFQIYRSRFLVFLVVGLAPALAMLATVLLSQFGPNPKFPAETAAALREINFWLPAGWPAHFVHCLVWPVFVYLASGVFLDDKPTLILALSSCKTRWQSWLALTAFLWTAIVVLPYAPSRVTWIISRHAASAVPPRTNNPSLLAVLLFNLAPWVMECVFSVMLSLSVPAWILEGQSVLKAIRRCWKLLKGSWTRIFTAWLMIFVLEWVLYFALFALTSIVFRVILKSQFGGAQFYSFRYNLMMTCIWTASVFLAPIYPIALTLFYYDQRIRREGYDIERMMDAAGLTAPDAPLTGASPATPIAPEAQP